VRGKTQDVHGKKVGGKMGAEVGDPTLIGTMDDSPVHEIIPPF